MYTQSLPGFLCICSHSRGYHGYRATPGTLMDTQSLPGLLHIHGHSWSSQGYKAIPGTLKGYAATPSSCLLVLAVENIDSPSLNLSTNGLPGFLEELNDSHDCTKATWISRAVCQSGPAAGGFLLSQEFALPEVCCCLSFPHS